MKLKELTDQGLDGEVTVVVKVTEADGTVREAQLGSPQVITQAGRTRVVLVPAKLRVRASRAKAGGRPGSEREVGGESTGDD